MSQTIPFPTQRRSKVPRPVAGAHKSKHDSLFWALKMAFEPSRELDLHVLGALAHQPAELAIAIRRRIEEDGTHAVLAEIVADEPQGRGIPHPTATVEDAAALVPAGMCWRVEQTGPRQASAWLWTPDTLPVGAGVGAQTPARALCAALVMRLINMERAN